MFDLGPAAREMTRLVSGVSQDQLAYPTPCADWTVTDLLAHIHTFASVFTANAEKRPVTWPSGLVDDWLFAIPRQLEALAEAWRTDSAWEGRVTVGGIEMATADNAVVAVEELTVHGWDLARATGQGLDARDADLDEVDRFFGLFGGLPEGQGPFGPEHPAAPSASRLERTIARTGRDPSWGSRD